MKINFLIFSIIGIVTFLYFYFSEYYFNINIGDSYYVVNYFYPVLILLVFGNMIYFFKLKKKQ